jgi:hypothetical protein
MGDLTYDPNEPRRPRPIASPFGVVWWFNYGDISSTLIDGRIVGGYVRLTSNTPLSYAVRAGHAWAESCAGLDVYDSNGLPCLPITPEMLVSA